LRAPRDQPIWKQEGDDVRRRVVATGAVYANRYISVLRIVDRKVTRWRDYLDPLAVFEAVGWPPRA
jgi:ketosteroid isomerase-like protein